MRESTLTVTNNLGLHARAAAQLVRIAGCYRSTIVIARADRQIYANAKSILSLLTLAAARGTELNINVEGEDEEDAMAAILGLFDNGFGEV